MPRTCSRKPLCYIPHRIVAPVSRPAVLAASTPPADLCGSGDPHYSRPGGRRYDLSDALRLRAVGMPAVPLAAGAQCGDLLARHLLRALVVGLAEAVQRHLPGRDDDPMPRPHIGG